MLLVSTESEKPEMKLKICKNISFNSTTPMAILLIAVKVRGSTHVCRNSYEKSRNLKFLYFFTIYLIKSRVLYCLLNIQNFLKIIFRLILQWLCRPTCPSHKNKLVSPS